jgi:uncharacterized membrane protein
MKRNLIIAIALGVVAILIELYAGGILIGLLLKSGKGNLALISADIIISSMILSFSILVESVYQAIRKEKSNHILFWVSIFIGIIGIDTAIKNTPQLALFMIIVLSIFSFLWYLLIKKLGCKKLIEWTKKKKIKQRIYSKW